MIYFVNVTHGNNENRLNSKKCISTTRYRNYKNIKDLKKYIHFLGTCVAHNFRQLYKFALTRGNNENILNIKNIVLNLKFNI